MPGPYGFVWGEVRHASRRGDKMLPELRDGVLGGNSAEHRVTEETDEIIYLFQSLTHKNFAHVWIARA